MVRFNLYKSWQQYTATYILGCGDRIKDEQRDGLRQHTVHSFKNMHRPCLCQFTLQRVISSQLHGSKFIKFLNQQEKSFTSPSPRSHSPRTAFSAKSHTQNKFCQSHFTLQKSSSIWGKGVFSQIRGNDENCQRDVLGRKSFNLNQCHQMILYPGMNFLLNVTTHGLVFVEGSLTETLEAVN